MNMIRYRQPYTLLNDIQGEVNRLFNRNFPIFDVDESNVETSEWLPAVDIKEEKNQFVIFADIPGVDPDKIEVHVDEGVLTIKGERKEESKEEREGYKRVERSYGVFYRRFSLPESANSEGIQATGKNGVLQITIPKSTKKNGTRKIDVKLEK